MSNDASDTSDNTASNVQNIGQPGHVEPKCATCGAPSHSWVTTSRGSGLLCKDCDDLPEKP